mmetsp:Transcript_5904/g.10544  ORF Transcript_5904/g.10544 Transcript_5904/m.10544 type:complete len:584 (-) Transcript_5904:49-1800(-)
MGGPGNQASSSKGKDKDSDFEGRSIGHVQDDVDDEDAEGQPLLNNKKSNGAYLFEGEDYEHPAALNLWGLVPFLVKLQNSFGSKLLMMLFVSQHLLKGFINEFTAPAIQYIYKNYQVAGPQMQIYKGVTHLPWAMKPVIGLLSDVLPIFGFNKSPYILIVAVMGTAATAAIGLTPQPLLSVSSLVICLFGCQLQFATTDLLTEAKYAEKMQSRPQEGPALMTYVWAGMQIGGLVATLLVGPTIEHAGPKMPFLLAVIPCSLIIVPILKGYMDEERLTEEQVKEARARILGQREACVLCLLMLAGTLILVIVGIRYQNVKMNALVSIAVAIVILLAFSAVLRPEIAKVTAWSLVQTSVSFSVGGGAFYFYTDTPEQYPEGPHFSTVFFTTVLGTMGSICSLIGIWSYQRYASDWTYRRLYLVSNVAISVLSITDVVFFKRLNVKWGIPDHAFVVGSSVFQGILMQWQWMPGVVMLSQLCPKGMEATMYALLAGCHNLGSNIAASCGAWLLQALSCNPSGAKNESEEFKYLWVGSAVGAVLPALTLFALPWFVPDKKQTDKLIKDGESSATKGSLWRRWKGLDLD